MVRVAVQKHSDFTMKNNYLTCLAFVSLLPFSAAAHAGVSAVDSASVSRPGSSADLPIRLFHTRSAKTAEQWTLRAGYQSFKNMDLQEIDRVDGEIFDMELIMPINDRLQARLYFPLNTNAKARVRGGSERVDVDGHGGLLDFPSLIFDYQFKQASGAGDYNLAAYAGIGHVFQYVESLQRNSGYMDRINHRGNSILFGMKGDKIVHDNWTFLTHLGGRFYWDSDDINPGGGSDMFVLLDASAAWVYTSENTRIQPAVELVFNTDFVQFASLHVVPQVIVPVGRHLDLHAGVSVGLLDDGPSTTARLQMSLSF